MGRWLPLPGGTTDTDAHRHRDADGNTATDRHTVTDSNGDSGAVTDRYRYRDAGTSY